MWLNSTVLIASFRSRRSTGAFREARRSNRFISENSRIPYTTNVGRFDGKKIISTYYTFKINSDTIACVYVLRHPRILHNLCDSYNPFASWIASLDIFGILRWAYYLRILQGFVFFLHWLVYEARANYSITDLLIPELPYELFKSFGIFDNKGFVYEFFMGVTVIE